MRKRNEFTIAVLCVLFIAMLIAIAGWSATRKGELLGRSGCDKIKSILVENKETGQTTEVKAFARTNDILGCENLKDYLIKEVKEGRQPIVDIATIPTEYISEILAGIAAENGISFRIFTL